MMAEIEENRRDLLASITDAGGRVRVRNAMYPALWLCGLIAVPCIVGLAFGASPHPILPYILCGVVATALFGFLFLLFWDRERLHSEDYLLRKQTLDLIEQKGSRKAIDAATVQVISEDQFLALPSIDDKSEGKK